MAVPIEYFTEQLKSIQLCQMEGKVTNVWSKERPGECFEEGIVEINGQILGQIYTTHYYCDANTMFDHFREYENFEKNHTKSLLKKIQEKFYKFVRNSIYQRKST